MRYATESRSERSTESQSRIRAGSTHAIIRSRGTNIASTEIRVDDRTAEALFAWIVRPVTMHNAVLDARMNSGTDLGELGCQR